MKNHINITLKTVFIKIIGFCVLVLGIIQIFIANNQAASGLKVNQFDSEVEKLTYENKKLENQIAKESSLNLVEKKARKLGFTQKASYVFLNQPLPIAFKHP